MGRGLVMISNRDDLINHLNVSTLCLAYREPCGNPSSIQYYFTDGADVCQDLVSRMVDNGTLAPKGGLFGDDDGQELVRRIR